MALRDMQAFIPGWNIVYILREKRAFERESARRQQELQDMRLRGILEITLAKSYAAQRNTATAAGEYAKAAEYDAKIAEIVEANIGRINELVQ